MSINENPITTATPITTASTSSSPNPNASTIAAQIADKIKANSVTGEANDLTSFETKKKVDDVKQKVYVFVLAVVCYLIYTYVSTALTAYDNNTKKIQELHTNIASVQQRIDTLKSNEEPLKKLTRESDVNAVIACINNENLCDAIDQSLKKDIGVTRSYLLLTQLTGSKMEIDQKAFLQYFNEYLLTSENNMRIGQLLGISFGDPVMIDKDRSIYKIQIDGTISFASKDAMMSMIEKIETGINPQNPLLIKLDSINYDIVKFEEPQTVNMSFSIYQYK